MPLPIKGREIRVANSSRPYVVVAKPRHSFARHALMIAYFLATKRRGKPCLEATGYAGVGSQLILIYAGIRPLASEHQHGLRKPLEPSAR
jgi:hypothetical protein